MSMENQVARCLFCQTGFENSVVEYVQDYMGLYAFIPKKIKRIKKHGVWTEEEHILFKSYVFVYSDDSVDDTVFFRIPRVIKLLGYNGGGSHALIGGDRAFADALMNQSGVFGTLKAVEVGGRVEVIDGLLKDMSGKVLRVDKRKQMAEIEFDIMGETRSVWLSYEVLGDFTG